MKTLTDANFDAELADSTWLVVFWASWCGPCMDLKHLEEFENTTNVKVGRVNIEENPDLATIYSVVIVPTYIFFKKGLLLKCLFGLQSCNSLKEEVI